MPKEYLNYTIVLRDGVYWAIVEGAYPMYCPNSDECDATAMVYPIPPGTTGISIKLNGAQLNWNNLTEQLPSEVHHTFIGNWAMIETNFKPLSNFLLEIHYEHPVMLVNDTYSYLYDLNISPYLSASNPNSTAYFNLKIETKLPNLKIFTVPNDNKKNPLNYSFQKYGSTTHINFEVTSENSEPLPGDILVTFSNTVPKVEWLTIACALSASIMIAILGISLALYYKKLEDK